MVTPEIVVDTSVAFKWFVGYGETGLEEAGALLLAHRRGEVELIAPSTLTVEIANTLRYLLPHAKDALDFLTELEATHLGLYAPTPDLVRRATERAIEAGVAVYDALFLALAEEHDCPLVTADRKAFEGAKTPIEIRLL